MYEVQHNRTTRLEADACGIGFLATRSGVAEHSLVQKALQLVRYFDHRGAPGHGAGLQIDIPWPLILDRFSAHSRLIAQRDVALGMFFLPFEAGLRRECMERVEQLAEVAEAPVLQWADVPICPQALPMGSSALRTLPVVRQALFRRPPEMSEAGWFTCRFMLRLALDHELSTVSGDEFAVTSLSNRTIVYKGLSELSRIGDLYPDLDSPEVASRFVLFHSRYCTNTTTAWRRAQPFWAIAHNGEISTIDGNRAWMNAIGGDLIEKLSDTHPRLKAVAERLGPIVSPSGSDTANLDDMIIALLAGGMTLPQAILALLPESEQVVPENHKLQEFYQAAKVYFGACDGPAALVACDGDHAVAHLDRNGLRPLWLCTSDDYVLASSELTGAIDIGTVREQRVMGPGETMMVKLTDGEILFHDRVRDEVARRPFPTPSKRIVKMKSHNIGTSDYNVPNLTQIQVASGMTEEDLEVILKPMFETGKPALGAMGDDTPMAAMLDHLPRRIEDHFALRFAQETSPPIDPIRDSWVFDSSIVLGDRRGPWHEGVGKLFRLESPILSLGERDFLANQLETYTVSLLFEASLGYEGHEAALEAITQDIVSSQAIEQAAPHIVILSDRGISETQASVIPLRSLARVHRALVKNGIRNRVSLVVDSAIWDIHHVALLLSLGADAVCPWIGCVTANGKEEMYLKGLRSGLTEVASMMGVTPIVAYTGARLVEAVGLDQNWIRNEFDVVGHLGGIGSRTVTEEWLTFHRDAFLQESEKELALVDAGEFRHTREGRPHSNNAEIVRSLHIASGFQKKIHAAEPGSWDAYKVYSNLVSDRKPITILDCLEIKPGNAIPLEEVEPLESIAWRLMAPGMSEGALSEPAHRAIAKGLNVLKRYCQIKACINGTKLPGGIGPIANSGEGGFDKSRVNTSEFNRSVQYAGGRFTITPMTAACADEAEVKFAQGAKPGKGGQLPGKKVSLKVAHQRGCEPGYELVSPPINHNLYSIEDVKLMVESWRTLNPKVNCALKYVATYGIEMVAMGGVNAGANRLHISDGCGGTGAAKRVDQKHAGVPAASVLPRLQDLLIEDNVRHLVEISVDGGVQNGEQALKLMLLGADRVGFGTSLLISIGCSMLRKCHLSGPDPSDVTGKRRLGCTPGIATQDPQWIARFAGNWKHVTKTLVFVAEEIRLRMAEAGIRELSMVVGRRDLLQRKASLEGKAAKLDFGSMLRSPLGEGSARDYKAQSKLHMPKLSAEEADFAERSLNGESLVIEGRVYNENRCIGVRGAGIIARKVGDSGLSKGTIQWKHVGAAGHFYGAYSLKGMNFYIKGVIADSCFTAAYGGKVVVVPEHESDLNLSLVGNAFGYGARCGEAYLAGRAGNRFGICLRQSHERTGVEIVVEGVGANAFQYMTGGVVLVLGSTGFNLGSGMTGGKVYLLDPDQSTLNQDYVQLLPVDEADKSEIERLLKNHINETQSVFATQLNKNLNWDRIGKVVTKLVPETF